MARQPAPGTRERILATTVRLFDEHGVQAVGLQRIIDECGCGKNLLYREFPSKDDLIAAYLDRCESDYNAAIENVIATHDGDPEEQVIAIFQWIADQTGKKGFRGCSFQNTHAECADRNHPVEAISVSHLAGLHERFATLAAQAGISEPSKVADRLLVVQQGLLAAAAVRPDLAVRAAAVELARTILATAGRRPESKSAPTPTVAVRRRSAATNRRR
jgi:AcrR family transcriptional regulator